MNEKIKLSLSLSAGLLEWKIDGHKLSLTDQSDPALLNNILRTVVPDAKFGFVLFGDHWHFGAAAPNLLKNILMKRLTLIHLLQALFVSSAQRNMY